MDRHLQTEYLRCIGVPAASPGFAYLRELIAAHLNRVPFELASKFLFARRRAEYGETGWLIPPADVFVRHLADFGLGGNCYYLNGNFGRLLRSLGFDAHWVRVRPGHAAIMVHLEGQAYYVDVGYGPFFVPIRLEDTPRFRAFGEEIIFTRLSEHAYEIHRQGGTSSITKTIVWVPVELDDLLDEVLHSYRDNDENKFMRRMLATVYHGDRCYQLSNETLIIKTGHSRVEQKITNRSEWIRMASRIFGIHPLMLESALIFLAERGVRFLTDDNELRPADADD